MNPRARALAAAGAFYAIAAAVFTWPLAARVNSGLPDLWDAKLNAWILNWDFHQTFRDPLHLFDANIFYPARFALAFSENLYGAALFGFPLYAAGASTLFVYNVLFLLGMWLSAMAAWALARESTGDGTTALVAGVVYAFVPWRLAQLPHIQFQWGAFLALALLFLLRYLENGHRRDAVLFSACFAWNALSNVHYAIFSGLLVLLVVSHETLAGGWSAMRRRVLGAGAAVTAAVVAVLPFYVPYRLASKLYGMQRLWVEIEAFSGRPIDFLTAGPQNKLYGPLTQKLAQPEGDFFPGLSVLALAVVAVAFLWVRRPASAEHVEGPFRSRLTRALDVLVVLLLLLWLAATLKAGLTIGPLRLRDPGRILVVATATLLVRLALAFPRVSRFADLGDFLRRRFRERRAPVFVLVAVLGVAIALGVHTPFYRFLVSSFGSLFMAIRVPSRGIVLFDLGLGVLAAWGLALATRRLSRRAKLAATFTALGAIGFEYRAFPIEIGNVDPKPAPVYPWLAGPRFAGGVLELPLGTDAEVEHVFRSTAHWKPIVNGYSGFAPPAFHALLDRLAQIPIPAEAWEKIGEAGAALVIYHPHETEGESHLAYTRFVRQAFSEGRLEPVAVLPHGKESDFVFRVAAAPPANLGVGPEKRRETGEQIAKALAYEESRLAPPFGVVDFPREDEPVAPGAWGFGWALDESGIVEVRIGLDGQPAGAALIGLVHPGVAEMFGRYPNAATAGFGFSVPKGVSGPHVLQVTLVARDGGTTILERRVVLRNPL